jgi:hypothetical protein
MHARVASRGAENSCCLSAKFSDYKLSARTRDLFVVENATKKTCFVFNNTPTNQE